MSNAYRGFNTRATPQTERATAEQVMNNAGGAVFAITPLERAKRFLILGSDKPTFYQKADALTRENAKLITELAADEVLGIQLVELIVDVSKRGLAPKQSPGLFALALVSATGTPAVKAAALEAVASVARTASTMFEFAAYREQFAGWGRGSRRAIANWYLSRTPEQMAFQMVKYRQRNEKTHRKMLRVSHPKTTDPARRAVFDWAIGRELDDKAAPGIVSAFEVAKTADLTHLTHLIRQYGMSWEMLPDAALADRKVWEALLENMPLGALIRQLPKLTNLGIIAPFGGQTKRIVERLMSTEELRRARIHPIKVLMAMKTYAAGQGMHSKWTPVQDVVDALSSAFYLAFGAIEPAGKRTLVGVDVSGSMSATAWGEAYGTGPKLQAREIAAAFALVTKATEPESQVFGFTGGFVDLGISPSMRLDDVLRKTAGLPFDRTDCAQPMIQAIRRGWEIDTFVVITDNETWSGTIHPFQALEQYRRVTNIPAKLVVLGTTATNFSVANPADAGMLDVVGFGADVPQLITEFSRGF